MKENHPLKIVKNKDNIFKATTSVNKVTDNTKNVRQELCLVEVDYTVLIETVHRFLGFSSKWRVDPRLFWLIGDTMLRFFELLDEIGFYLIQQNQTLARDIGISESSIRKILSFRKRFPGISMVDPTILWSKYRDNQVPLVNNDGKV
jgi:hypothetical protein